MREAKKVEYDITLPYSEDKDFLLRVMLGKPYALLGRPLYVYTEHESVTEDKILRSLKCNRHIYLKYLKTHPIASRMRLIETVGKMVAYRIAFSVDLHEAMIHRRSASPNQHQLQDYLVAHAKVVKRINDLNSKFMQGVAASQIRDLPIGGRASG
jgi:hypothetical protein